MLIYNILMCFANSFGLQLLGVSIGNIIIQDASWMTKINYILLQHWYHFHDLAYVYHGWDSGTAIWVFDTFHDDGNTTGKAFASEIYITLDAFLRWFSANLAVISAFRRQTDEQWFGVSRNEGIDHLTVRCCKLVEHWADTTFTDVAEVISYLEDHQGLGFGKG